MNALENINPALWVVSNMTLFYASALLVVWVALYGWKFRWQETPAGQLVFWFTLSLLGVVALSFIGIFVNGRQAWWEYPPDVLLWRPALRYLIYLGVAVTITRMTWSLVQRLRGRAPLMFEVVPRRRDPR